MDHPYSGQFFKIFVENLQSSCQNYLNFDHFVEISGYINVEMDNLKKERYVLSELLQSSGNMVSESFCTKVLSISDLEINPPAPSTTSSQRTLSGPVPRQRHRRKPSQTYPSRKTSDCSQLAFAETHGESPLGCMVLPLCSDPETVPVSTGPAWSSATTEHLTSEWISERKRPGDSPFNVSQFKLYRPASTSTSEYYSEHDGPEFDTISQETGHGPKAKKAKPIVQANTDAIQFQVPVGSEPHSPMSESASKGIKQNPESKPFSELQVMLPRSASEEGCESNQLPILPGAFLDGSNDVLYDDNNDMIQPSQYSSSEKYNSIDLNSGFVDAPFDSLSFKMPPNTNPGSYSVLKSVVKRFKRYHIDKSGEDVDMVNTSPVDLNNLLLEFYMGAKKGDGSELTGGSLKNIQVYLERYLKEAGYPYSITKDNVFKTSREYVKSKNDGSRVKYLPRYVPLDEDDIKVMFQNKVLGGYNPDTLFNTLWFINARFFAWRKPGEHFTLKWGELSLNSDDCGQEYLERHIHDGFSLKLFANLESPNECFVKLYKQYRDLRPTLMMADECPFYLKLNKSPSEDSWFLDQPMPWSPFTCTWKKLLTAAGLPLNKKII